MKVISAADWDQRGGAGQIFMPQLKERGVAPSPAVITRPWSRSGERAPAVHGTASRPMRLSAPPAAVGGCVLEGRAQTHGVASVPPNVLVFEGLRAQIGANPRMSPHLD